MIKKFIFFVFFLLLLLNYSCDAPEKPQLVQDVIEARSAESNVPLRQEVGPG